MRTSLPVPVVLGVAALCVAAAAPPGRAPSPDLSLTADEILAGTNAFRREQSLGQVAEDPVLDKVAGAFAAYLARTGRFAHEADGRTPAQRAVAGGYDYCEVAENLAWREDSRGFEALRLGRLFVEDWKQSPGHRRNLMDPDVTQIGVGVARGEGRLPRYVAVQLFGRPASLRYSFQLSNRAGQPVTYAVGERRQTIAPQTIITHTVCGREPLTFDSAVSGAAAAALTPGPGAVYLLRRGPRGGVVLEAGRAAGG